MTATLSPVRVTSVPKIAVKDVADGLANAIGAIPALDAAADEWPDIIGRERWNADPSFVSHPADGAWSDFSDEVIAELAPEVTRMLRQAYKKRLPWTWEPEAE